MTFPFCSEAKSNSAPEVTSFNYHAVVRSFASCIMPDMLRNPEHVTRKGLDFFFKGPFKQYKNKKQQKNSPRNPHHVDNL